MNKRKIAMSMMSHQEEVQLLQDKIKALEHALMMSNIKAEGYEIMMDILKREHGIDLSKKSRSRTVHELKERWSGTIIALRIPYQAPLFNYINYIE